MENKLNLTEKLLALSMVIVPAVLFLISGATGVPAILGVLAFIVIGVVATLCSCEETRRQRT